MLEKFRNYIEGKGQCIRIFREKADSVVALVRQGGVDRICRMYAHPVPAYAIAAGLSCPALPAVYRCEADRDGCYLVEEEFVDGISLGELMEVYHPDSSQTAALAMQVCTALEMLHGRGVIHRDIKPENVLITSAGRVVLIDLDAATEYDAQKTRDTTLLGTAGYAAPEQFGFSRSNVRTDIFSLGVMMNVLLTGKHPSTQLTDGPLRGIIEKCIEINVDKRYASATELKKALARHAGAQNVCAECGFVSPGGGCLCCGINSAQPFLQTRKRRLLAGVLALALAICVFLCLPRDRGETQAPELSSPMETPESPSAPPEAQQPSPLPTEMPAPEQRQLYYSRHVSPEKIETLASANADLYGHMVCFWLDAEGTQPLPKDCLLRTSGRVGEFVYSAQNKCWLWTTVGVLPTYQSETARIFTTVDGVEYSMSADIYPQLYPLYSVPERNPSEPNENYIAMSGAGKYSYTFTEANRSLYAIPLQNYVCDAESLYCDSEDFSCVFNENTSVIEIRYLGDLTTQASCAISFSVTVPNASGQWDKNFRLVHMPADLEFRQLYPSFATEPDQVVRDWMQLPAENRTAQLFWLDSKKTVPVPRDAVFAVPPELGKITRDAANQCWCWSTENAVPGATGWVSVEVDGLVYRCEATVGLAWYNLYTEPTYDVHDMGKNYIFKDEAGKLNFSYSPNERTAYIIPLPNLTIDMENLESSSDAFEFKLDSGGVLHVTLKDGVSGVVETALSLQGSMPNNGAGFKATLQIVFRPK